MHREGRWHGDRHIYPLMCVRWGRHTCVYPRGPPVHAPLWRADPSLGTPAELPGSSGGSEAEGGWGGAGDHSHSCPAGRGSRPAPGSWWAQLSWGGLGLALGHFPPGTDREKLVCPQGWECGCPPNPGTPVVYVDTASVTSCRRWREHGNPVGGLRENTRAPPTTLPHATLAGTGGALVPRNSPTDVWAGTNPGVGYRRACDPVGDRAEMEVMQPFAKSVKGRKQVVS